MEINEAVERKRNRTRCRSYNFIATHVRNYIFLRLMIRAVQAVTCGNIILSLQQEEVEEFGNLVVTETCKYKEGQEILGRRSKVFKCAVRLDRLLTTNQWTRCVGNYECI